MKDWLSIGQLQEQTGIPDRTLRRYLARYREHLTLQTHHRSYRVHPTALPILVTIRDLYAQGKSHDEVLQYVMDGSRAPISPQPYRTHAPGEDSNSLETESQRNQTDLRDAIDGLREQLETTRSQLAAEAEARTAAEEARDRYILKRDEQLIATMRHLLGERKKPWWHRRGTSVV